MWVGKVSPKSQDPIKSNVTKKMHILNSENLSILVGYEYYKLLEMFQTLLRQRSLHRDFYMKQYMLQQYVQRLAKPEYRSKKQNKNLTTIFIS